jgi:hypothetical protein
MLSAVLPFGMSHSRRVEVFLRGTVPFDARTRQLVVLGRVRALHERGLIDDVRVDTWANRVTDGPADAVLALTALEGFEHWATAHHASLAPGFETHEGHCGFTDQHYHTTTFPVVCLAIYEDDRLVSVFPHSTASGCQSVADGLAMLEIEGDTEPPTADPSTVDRDHPSA